MAALNATLRPLDLEHRCAQVRTLWAHVQARDWAAMRAAFADDAVMDWPCSDERFVGADTIVGVNAAYPEGWVLWVLAVDALADGREHSLIEVRRGEQRFYAHSRFTFDGPLITAAVEHWATAEAPPAWRNAALLGSGYQRIDPPAP